MKNARAAAVVFLCCMVLLTGCDKVKEFLAAPPAEEDKPTAAPVPELEIIGVTEVEQIALKDLLKVKGLLQQAEDYVVMINTQLVRKGEIMRLQLQMDRYDVKVLTVTEMRVVLEATREGGPKPSSPPPAK